MLNVNGGKYNVNQPAFALARFGAASDNSAVSLPRFYAPELDPARAEVPLPADEARHLTRVLRLSVGDEIAVFDGRGHEARARVTHAARDRVLAEVIEPLDAAAEPGVAIALALAVLKPEAMDDAVRDATMMGVARIDPLITEHIAVKERALADRRVVERWHRIAIASAKQSRRARIPVIGAPARLDDWLRGSLESLRVLLVEPAAAGDEPADLRTLADRPRPDSVAILVGPEGGWSEGERRRAVDAGCVPATLGRLTLRADAVPVAAVALVRFILGDL